MLKPDIKTKIAQTGETIHDFAARAGVDRTVFYRKREITERIAWKLARAYAELTGLSADQAYTQIIIEDAERQRDPLKDSAAQGERP